MEVGGVARDAEKCCRCFYYRQSSYWSGALNLSGSNMKEGIRVGLGARELSCQVIKCVLIQSLCLHNFNFILLKIVPDTESVMTHEVWKNVPGLDIMRRAWYVTYAKSIMPPRCKKLLDYESWAQTTRCIWVGWQSAEEEQKHLREEHTFANTLLYKSWEK